MLGPVCFGLPAEKLNFLPELMDLAVLLGLAPKKRPERKICEATLLSKGVFRRGKPLPEDPSF